MPASARSVSSKLFALTEHAGRSAILTLPVNPGEGTGMNDVEYVFESVRLAKENGLLDALDAAADAAAGKPAPAGGDVPTAVERVARALCRLRCIQNFGGDPVDEGLVERAVDSSWRNWLAQARVAVEAMAGIGAVETREG
jgi:hypothetical protein